MEKDVLGWRVINHGNLSSDLAGDLDFSVHIALVLLSISYLIVDDGCRTLAGIEQNFLRLLAAHTEA